MGEFTLARDSVAPKFLHPILNQSMAQQVQVYEGKISDDFQIKSYKGSINGQWVLFEYEPKRNSLTYDFSDIVFETAKHELELEVEDNVGNKSIYKTTFFRKYNLN